LTSRALPAFLAVLALAWLMLLCAAPLQAAGTTLSAAAYALSSFICHQQAERSFHLGVAQIPVCARCLGLYAGAALGAMISVAGTKVPAYGRTAPSIWTVRWGRKPELQFWLIVAAVPTLATWSMEFAGLWYPSNIIRAVAAVPLGVAVAMVVSAAAAGRRLR
jgi:uncharacterized membrane protein